MQSDRLHKDSSGRKSRIAAGCTFVSTLDVTITSSSPWPQVLDLL